ncbi:MAG: exosortase-dependent surface protein XDP2 [Pirellula sp.]
MCAAFAVAVGSSGVAQAAITRPISGFQSVGTPGQATTGNRTFVETGFVGTNFKFTTDNISQFKNGELKFTSNNVNYQYGWTDVIPSDLGSGNDYPLNPDRGDTATPFAGEPVGGTLQEVFGTGNLAYLLDGEADVQWTLDLLFETGFGIDAYGDDSTIDLMMLERGANSMLGVRAILANRTLSQDLIVNFRESGTNYGVEGKGGLTDYQLNTTEIGGAQKVAGVGIDLSAFGLSAGTQVIGFQYFVNRDTNLMRFDGPDFLGFIATQQVRPVPEPSTLVVASLGSLCLAYRTGRRRKLSN